MCEHQKRIQCVSQAQVFEQLSRVMSSTGIYIKNLGEMMRKGFSDHLKYNLHEAETFKDLFGHRDNVAQAYLKSEKALQEKKEKLFKMRDPTKWGAAPKELAEMIKMR